MRHNFRGKLKTPLVVLGCHACLALGASAEVTHDGSFSSASLTGPNYQIQQAQGKTVGTNLFHSFSKFDLAAGQSANFSGSNSIRNILARVTGGTASNINGAINSQISGANFYFINPAGIVFGPNASINVSGDFAASTADRLELSDGAKFNAVPGTEDALLTSAPLAAFGFVSTQPKAITVSNAYLTVNSGKTFRLVGGDLDITNSAIISAGSKIELAALRSAARVALPSIGDLDTSSASALGDINFSQSLIDTSGNDGGRIVIRGGKLVATASSIDTSTSGNAGSRGISITAKTSARFEQSTRVASETFSSGPGGSIEISSPELTFTGGSNLNANTSGSGTGGKITVEGGNLTLDNTNSFFVTGISADALSDGNSGGIALNLSGKLAIINGAVISSSTFAQGNSGAIEVQAGQVLIDGGTSFDFTGINAQTFALANAGKSGNISLVVAGETRLLNGGKISSSTFGNGLGGGISVDSGSLFLDGQGSNKLTGILAQTNGGAIGGDLDLDVSGLLTILGGARISTNTAGASASGSMMLHAENILIDGSGTNFFTGITALALGNNGGGAGGRIDVKTDQRITLLSGGQITSGTQGDGAAGDVSIHARELHADRRGSSFFTGVTAISSATGISGAAGNILLEIENLLSLRAGALIDSSTFGTGAGGDVQVTAGSILIDRAGSEFFTGIGSDTNALLNGGVGGSVSVKTTDLTLLDGGLISTGTFGSGDAGTIQVQAKHILANGRGSATENVVSPFSGIVASTSATSSGNGGSVIVQSDSVILQNSSLIGATTEGTGNGGMFGLSARDLLLNNSSIASRSTGTGFAGSITIDARLVNLRNNSAITVSSLLTDAGNASVVSSGDLNVYDSSITARATGNGGSIFLGSQTRVDIVNGSIIAEAGGNGGNITIERPKFVVLNDSIVSANAIFGNGGQIFIGSDVLLANNSPITASSQFGADGTVQIDAIFDLSNSVAELDAEFIDASQLLQPRCVTKIPERSSSFMLAGQGGLPTQPGDFSPSHELVPLPNSAP